MNARGPLYMEQALAAIHQGNPHGLPLQLLFGQQGDTVTLFCRCPAETGAPQPPNRLGSDYAYQVFLVDAGTGGDGLVYTEGGPAACGGPGRAASTVGVPLEQILAHEYGHHVSANRSNPPWQAVDWGPKRWATYLGVCPHAVRGEMFPGDEGAAYELNPGEGWGVLTDRWGYSNDKLVTDNNLYQDRVTTYAAWDDKFLYLALKGAPSTTELHLAGAADRRSAPPSVDQARMALPPRRPAGRYQQRPQYRRDGVRAGPLHVPRQRAGRDAARRRDRVRQRRCGHVRQRDFG